MAQTKSDPEAKVVLDAVSAKFKTFSTVEAGFAAGPVPWPRQLADVPGPCLHQRAGLVLVPELRF